MRRRLAVTLAIALAVAAAAIGGCAASAPPRSTAPFAERLAASGPLVECARAVADHRERARAEGVRDAQAEPVHGFPYLRVDRYHAAVKPEPADPAFDGWARALARLGDEARAVETANLGVAWWARRLEDCADRLLAADLGEPGARSRLAVAATAPEHYVEAWRALGLYPITALPFLAGVARLHESMRADFSVPLDRLPVAGRLVRWVPPADRASLAPGEVAVIARRIAGAPAFVQPRLSEIERERLFATFAPAITVDVATSADRIGAPGWTERGRVAVDLARPTVYRKLSRTRFGDETLLQLSYVVWFPARPRTGSLDLLGGHLDGVTWRVTLAADGRPLLFDAMHNCGCYHLFLPTERLRPRAPPDGLEEPALVPATVSSGLRRAVLRLEHGTHYLQRAHGGGRGGVARVRYAFADYDRLRSLPVPGGGRRSLFGPDGIVPGTERAERYVFWPMGVPSPGAMRQWGRHATAFVGRRHFDDPDLIERYFVAVNAP